MADAQGLRPTPDRIRETLFNWLQATIHGANCLDMFAGSGALGIEAVSRGAASSVLIEQDRKTAETLRESVKMLDADEIVVQQADVLQWIKTADQVFDIIFLDPPFADDLHGDLCKLLDESSVLTTDALVYIEEDRAKPEVVLPRNWKTLKTKSAGNVRYSLVKPASKT